MIKRRYRFLALMTLALLLTGCSVDWEDLGVMKSPTRADTPEQLLAARGSWKMVEEDTSPSPVNSHMKARSQVDPDNQAKVAQYASRGPAPDEDVRHRVLRLEKTVSDLQRDFARLLPPLSSLIISDAQLDATIREIQTTQNNASIEPSAGAASAPVPAPALAAVASKPVNPVETPEYNGGAPAVVNVRTGVHSGKTRLVLDLTAPGQYQADLDNAENVLVVTLPGLAWSAVADKSLANNPVIKGYTARPVGDGTVLAVELKKPSRVLMSTALPPNPINNHHRLVFDLAI